MEPVKEVQETTAVDLGGLLDAGDNAVVTLVAGNTRLVAHTAVLAARSPVFAAMFCDDTLHASDGHVTIPDMEGRVLRQLLVYCYTLQVPQLPGMAPQLLAAASKYGVSSLKEVCERQLATQLAAQRAAEGAVAAAVRSLRHAVPGLTGADAADLVKTQFQAMATQGSPHEDLSQPKDVVRVRAIFAQSPAETRQADTTGGPHHTDRRTPTTVASPAAAHCSHTPSPAGGIIWRIFSAVMWILSGRERSRKLIQATKEGEVEKVRTLLAEGADLTARDDSGMTALHWAAREGHLEVASALVEGGAEVNARMHTQDTPLHFAAVRGHLGVVQLLLGSFADPNVKNQGGRTPLHDAAWTGHTQVAAALLVAGANRWATDIGGKTPLDLARGFKKQQLIEILS